MSRKVKLTSPAASARARVNVGHPLRSVARRLSHRGRSKATRACIAFGRRRREWMAIGAAVGSASAHHARQVGRPFSAALRRAPRQRHALGQGHEIDSPAQAKLEPAQRRTLEAGSCIVLSGLGIGFEVGSWPTWSFMAAIGLYCAWVVLYAEIAVRTSRGLQVAPARWWHAGQRSRRFTSPRPPSASKSQPPQEERTA